MFNKEQIKQLSAPLDRANVKTRSQSGHTLSYLEGWHVIDSANQILGFDGWSSETVFLNETSRDLVTVNKWDRKTKQWIEEQQWRISYICKVRVTVGNVVREGTGFGSGFGKPESIGDAIEGAVKEAETDAMKRAFRTFGYRFGLALYDKTQSNVESNPGPDKAKSTQKTTRKPNPENLKKVQAAVQDDSEKPINPDQVAEFNSVAAAHGWTTDGIRSLIESTPGIDSVESIPRGRFQGALKALKNEELCKQHVG